jgi:exopolysaccharide biosynthesis polyprenyl glycosylphosphotransferase
MTDLWPDFTLFSPAAMMAGALAGLLAVAAYRSTRAAAFDADERLLLVGTSPLLARLVQEIDARDLPWRVVGIVADPHTLPAPVGPWLGAPSDIGRVITATQVTRVVVTPSERRRPTAARALLDARLRGVAIDDAAEMLEHVTGKLPIERLSAPALLRGGGFHHSDLFASDSTGRAARVVSLIGAVLGIVLLSPILALIALTIRLDSRGPVFFVQPRVGIGGRAFPLIKFRTMHVAAERPSEWVRDNGHRITRVGRWLRRFRLDELPQLFNVIAGHMNLVGPRPHPASNYLLFSDRIPHYRLRTTVRPGITGWAQIRYGYANGLEEETEKMRYDLYYIKHRSVWLDLRILIETFAVVAMDRRSYEHAGAPAAPAPWPSVWPLSRRAALR